MALTVGVLGPIEARRDGVLLAIPAGKTRELLARLAMDAGRQVRVDVLLDDLWNGEPTARNTLQSKVSQLRRAIGADLVVGSTEGYLLALPAEAVDAWRLEESARTCADAFAADDPAGAMRAARTGLGLFRGEALADLGPWTAPYRTRLVQQHGDLLEQSMVARVELGAGIEVVAELESLLLGNPLREGLWSSLVVALYRAGRQSEALGAYQRARRLLRDELGVEPSPQLQAAERRVLQHSAALVRPRLPLTPGNLPPAERAPMVGRDRDVEELLAEVSDHRLVTLLGAGGVGKTRLALEIAHRVDAPPGGVWLVRLDGVDPGTDLFGVLAETLQVTGGERAVRDRVAGAETLLVLDNCEHLVAPVATLLRSLLDVGPRLRVLVTSQAPLGLAEEQRHQLQPLSHADSVTLFTRRASQARRGLVLDEATRIAIEEACRSLDGLPLAIELAAARARALAIADIARRLDDRFTLLEDPSNPSPGRRQALAAAIGWSCDLLGADDQRVLGALAGFVGGADLAALEFVLTALDLPAKMAADAVTRLVDRSLISIETAEDDRTRYGLMDSIRLYVLDRLARDGTIMAVRAAHAAWCADRADWCDARIRTQQQAACLRLARAERANLEVALAWCREHDRQLGARIAGGFGWTWVVLGEGTSGAARVRSATGPHCTPQQLVSLGLSAAWLEASAGDVALAQSDLDQVRSELDDLPKPPEPRAVADADLARHRAFVAIQQGQADLVRRAATEAWAGYDANGLTWGSAAALLLRAYGSIMAGETGPAGHDATAALAVLRPLGDSWGVVHGEAMLGSIAQAEHRFDDAAAALQRAVVESEALGFVGQAALHRATLARVRHRAGDPRAADSYETALRAALACGDGRLAATVRVNLARLLRWEGDSAGAVGLLEENQRWYEIAGGGDFALLTRCLLASARDDRAELGVVLTAARADAEPDVAVLALDALARLAAQAAPERARSLLAEADATASTVGHSLDPADRADRRACLEALSASS